MGLRWWRLGSMVGLMLACYFLVPVSREPTGGLAVRLPLALIALVALGASLGHQLRRHVRTGTERAEGLIAAIVLVLVVFALAFYILDSHRPGQVANLSTRIDALYFSAATMLTIGYGDVHAVGQAARTLALAQMVFDVVYVAAAVRLLGAQISLRAPHP